MASASKPPMLMDFLPVDLVVSWKRRCHPKRTVIPGLSVASLYQQCWSRSKDCPSTERSWSIRDAPLARRASPTPTGFAQALTKTAMIANPNVQSLIDLVLHTQLVLRLL